MGEGVFPCSAHRHRTTTPAMQNAAYLETPSMNQHKTQLWGRVHHGCGYLPWLFTLGSASAHFASSAAFAAAACKRTRAREGKKRYKIENELCLGEGYHLLGFFLRGFSFFRFLSMLVWFGAKVVGVVVVVVLHTPAAFLRTTANKFQTRIPGKKQKKCLKQGRER